MNTKELQELQELQNVVIFREKWLERETLSEIFK